MYQQLNGILPEPLLNSYSLCSDIHSHNTRQAKQLHKHGSRTVLVAKSFTKLGPEYRNKVPDEIKESKTIKSFNQRHKLYLLNAQFDMEHDCCN